MHGSRLCSDSDSAGFPTGIKWKTVHAAAGDRKYVVCDIDEGDSGTFAGGRRVAMTLIKEIDYGTPAFQTTKSVTLTIDGTNVTVPHRTQRISPSASV